MVPSEEFDEGARITLEEGPASRPFAIESGVYGKMMHTRFFQSLREAEAAYDEMKPALVTLINTPLAFADEPFKSVRGVPRTVSLSRSPGD